MRMKAQRQSGNDTMLSAATSQSTEAPTTTTTVTRRLIKCARASLLRQHEEILSATRHYETTSWPPTQASGCEDRLARPAEDWQQQQQTAHKPNGCCWRTKAQLGPIQANSSTPKVSDDESSHHNNYNHQNKYQSSANQRLFCCCCFCRGNVKSGCRQRKLASHQMVGLISLLLIVWWLAASRQLVSSAKLPDIYWNSSNPM